MRMRFRTVSISARVMSCSFTARPTTSHSANASFCTCTATVVRANWFERHWTQLTAIFELDRALRSRLPAEGVTMDAHIGDVAINETTRWRPHGNHPDPALLHHRLRRRWTASTSAPVRAEWDDADRRNCARDTNKGHFIRNAEFDIDLSTMPRAAAQGVHRFPGQLRHRRVLRLRALRRNQEAHQEPRHEGTVRLHEPRRGAPCRLHQRHAEGLRRRRRPRLPDARRRNTPSSSRSSSSTPPTCPRRSATRATSRSSASSSGIRNGASTRSSTGSRSGATTSSATARRSRC